MIKKNLFSLFISLFISMGLIFAITFAASAGKIDQ